MYVLVLITYIFRITVSCVLHSFPHNNSVQAKLRCLHDYHLRLLHNVLPAPSGVDIANAIKYFSTTFLSKQTIFNLNSLFFLGLSTETQSDFFLLSLNRIFGLKM